MNAAQWRRAASVAALLALLAYLEILGLHMGAVAGGSDSSGYMNHAKLLAVGTVHAEQRLLAGVPQNASYPYLYIPLGFKPAWNGAGMVPTYPIGLSLFIIVAKTLIGWRYAGDMVMMLHAAAGVAATYWLARVLDLSRAWSLLCAAAIALSPLYMFMSLSAMTDVPSLAWTTLAVVAALRSRDRASWALLAGVALSLDVLLRPTNVMALVPVLIALGVSWRRWACLAVAGIPGAVALFAYNAAAYGSPFITGYGDGSGWFQASQVPGTVLHYVRWLPALFTPLIIPAVATPFLATGKFRPALLLTSWFLVFAGFYAFYQNTHEAWWYLRFLLPAAPALVVGSALVLRALMERVPRLRALASSPTAFTTVAGLLIASSILWTVSLGALRSGEEELRYGDLSQWMKAQLPSNAVCLSMQASGSIFFYTPFTILRYDMLDQANAATLNAALADSRRPLYAVLFPYEVERFEKVEKMLQGRWRPIGTVGQASIFQRIDPPKGT